MAWLLLNLDIIPSYFPENQTKLDYIEALTSDPPANDEKLRQLLFKRAIESLVRTKLLQEERPSLLNLCRSGALSEIILKSFQTAEKETSEEVFEIQADAEMLHEGNLYIWCTHHAGININMNTILPLGWSKAILHEAALFMRRQVEIAPNAKLSSTCVNTPSLFGDPSSLNTKKKN